MNRSYDIRWHNCEEEMPGTLYEYNRHDGDGFIVRYTFEDEDIEVHHEIATLKNGIFVLNFDDWPEEDRERIQKKVRVLHWALLDHPSDYD